VLDAYQRAPGDISDALLPDPFQVEAQRPLEPLQLPIHHERERAGRLEALMSRAGMINLYNELLDLRTSIGTLARGVRVLLGFMAAGEIRRRAARIAAILGQILQGWLLLGVNLFRLAPLVPTFVAALLHLAPRAEHGASAGEIIFRWQVVLPLQKVARHALSLLLLIVLWLAASGLVALAPLAIAQALGSISAVPWLGAQRGLVAGLLYVAIALVALVVSHAHPWTGLKRATLYLATLLPFAIQWAAVLVLPILAVQFVAGGFVLASVGRGWGSTLRDSWFGAYVHCWRSACSASLWRGLSQRDARRDRADRLNRSGRGCCSVTRSTTRCSAPIPCASCSCASSIRGITAGPGSMRPWSGRSTTILHPPGKTSAANSSVTTRLRGSASLWPTLPSAACSCSTPK